MAIAAALACAAATCGSSEARSPFAYRGIVEGEYGPPWDHGARQRMLAFMAAHGMDVYVHAPKDDLYERTQWRDPYPPAQQREFDAEIAFARRHRIEWVPNVDPALAEIPTPAAPTAAPSAPICFSCASDLDVLVAKLMPFVRAGARSFMVSFDDVQRVLTYPQDIAVYGEGDTACGRANGDLLTRLLRRLRSISAGTRLLTVGAVYSGSGDGAYLDGLRATLDRAVEVRWTGPETFSVPIDPAGARAYARSVGRMPILWDNWTVNDADGNIVARTTRIHLGQYDRGRTLVGAVRGVLLNPMNEADLNALPFTSAAAYLAAPRRFRPRSAFLRATRSVGGAAADTLRAFAEVNYSSHFDLTQEAPTFTARAAGFLRAYAAGGGWGGARQALERELGLVAGARRRLSRVRSLRRFVAEADAFLTSAAESASAAGDGIALLAAERPELSVAPRGRGFVGRALAPDPAAADARRNDLAASSAAVAGDPHLTFGYRGFVFDTPPIAAPPNKLDAFLANVRALDVAWVPEAQEAAQSIRVLLGGRAVRLGPSGRFSLGRRAAGKTLEAIDGAGGRTDVRVAATDANVRRR